MEEATVMIVGAGPSGLAISACLNLLSIPNIVLEKEDCTASLWKKRSYDRLKLHLAKQYCTLPHMLFTKNSPTFVPKCGFIEYLDSYASNFGIKPKFCRSVESAVYDGESRAWRLRVKNLKRNEDEVYAGRFLVVATGENSEGSIPDMAGLDGFEGEYLHSSKYENGKRYIGKNVLVVGCGNSGMEIAFDLSTWGATSSIVARGPVHVLTKETVYLGMFLLKYLPCKIVDKFVVILSKLKHGDLSKYGLQRPNRGPFHIKATTGRSPTIDVGCIEKIKAGAVQVFPSIKSIEGNKMEFENGKADQFDAIIFATGYNSTVRRWLKDDGGLFDEKGMPKRNYPNHWKGENGIYCVGFASRGLLGISNDAENVAKDISLALGQDKKCN